MTIQEFKKYLTDEQFEKFIINFQEYYPGIKFDDCFSRHTQPERIISQAFIWKNTTEGGEYWNKIHSDLLDRRLQ